MKHRPWQAALTKYSVGLLLLVVLIEIIASLTGLPHFWSIVQAIRAQWVAGVLPHDIQVTGARWLAGWSIGSMIGLIFGFLTGRLRWFAGAFEGLLILLRAIPFVTLLPVCLRIWGLSEAGKFFLIAWASAGVVWVVAHHAARSIPIEFVWRAASLGCSRMKWIFRLLLPASMSGIVAALRTSLLLALLVVAVAEMGGVYERTTGFWWSEGLGYRIFRSYELGDDEVMLGSMTIFAIIGIVVEQVFLGVCIVTAHIHRVVESRLVKRQVRRLASQSANASPDTSSAEPVVSAALEAGYDGRPVISGLDVRVDAGNTLAIVGPSGCGKTTLIRALGHFGDADFKVSGSVQVGAYQYSNPGPWVGVVFQDAPVFEHLTVWGNVTFGNRVNTETDKRYALTLLSTFGLGSIAHRRASTLSGGQRQRLALATALVNRPSLLLLDESFGSLDAITRRKLQEFYWRNVHGKATAVFVTHDLVEAVLIADCVQVGVQPDAFSVTIDKQGMDPHQWELTEDFHATRLKLISALGEQS